MKVTVERESKSEALVTVELEWSELEKASDRAFHKLAQRYKVPGFRPGHAPRSMLERMLGKETIYQEGLESLIADSYREAVRANNLTPLAEPTLDAPPLELNQPYTFTARIPVLAPVVLGDYKHVRVQRPSVEITDEDVQRVERDLQEQQAAWVPAERPAQVGDRVVVDLKLEAAGRTVSDLEDNEFELVETREGIFTGMDEHIVEMTEGETREFTATIPADYANAELAGQESHYTVTLKSAKYRELPAIDDELAKAAGSYETLDELRTAIREQLQARREETARRDYREQVVKTVADQAEVEIHPVLVEDEAALMLREMERVLQQSGLTLEQFLTATGRSEEEYRKGLEPTARERVKIDLVLDAIADAEGMTVSDAELREWLDVLERGGTKVGRLRQLTPGQRQHLINTIRRERVTEQLLQRAESPEDGAGAPAPTVADPEGKEGADDTTLQEPVADDAVTTAGAVLAAQVGAQEASAESKAATLPAGTSASASTEPGAEPGAEPAAAARRPDGQRAPGRSEKERADEMDRAPEGTGMQARAASADEANEVDEPPASAAAESGA